jgi:predicted dehydrogenase
VCANGCSPDYYALFSNDFSQEYSMSQQEETYGLGRKSSDDVIAAPLLSYRPRNPRNYSPHIGLIACGGITEQHLTAYKKAGYQVTALCDADIEKAEARRTQFYPEAITTSDFNEILQRDDIEVVDIAAHPAQRAPLIEAALHAGKHVLSQKPFVLDLSTGEKLVDLAEEKNLKLAVNQNGRWAPHFAYMRQALAAGVIGEVASVDFGVQWNHNWIKGTPFDSIHHIVLYDFAIHWFDMAAVLLNGKTPRKVTASVAHSPSQQATPPLLAQAIVECDGAQATFVFNADTQFGSVDRTNIIGSKGTLRSTGADLSAQNLELFTADGHANVPLEGSWFPDGFWGTMSELLCAIEEEREPANSARQNLKSLELCFAACASADSGTSQVPGAVRSVPASCIAKS